MMCLSGWQSGQPDKKENKMFKFKKIQNAEGFKNKCLKAHAIILGDDGMFWVVTLAAMERLLKQGYEIAA